MTKVNTSAYEYIIEANMGLVYQIVAKFYVSQFDRDDLVQAGSMGLLKAARLFDITKGYQFSTYAVPFIMGSIKEEMRKRKWMKVSRYYQKMIYDLKSSGEMDLQTFAQNNHISLENAIIASQYMEDVQLLDDWEMIPSAIDVTDQTEGWDLREEDRKLYLWRIQYHMSEREIAKKLGISQSTVSRKLKQLRLYLSRQKTLV